MDVEYFRFSLQSYRALWLYIYIYIHIFNCYLAAPRPTLGHYWGGSLTHLMLITCVLHMRPKGDREPRNEVGSLSPAKHLVGFELGTFQSWLQHLNPYCMQLYFFDWCFVTTWLCVLIMIFLLIILVFVVKFSWRVAVGGRGTVDREQ